MPKFPFYAQPDQMDCGPTCLRMVAKYHGKSYSIQNLREKTQISREGVSLLGIAEAAEAIGMRSLAVKISLETLITDVPLPCVVHWEQNHFVVVYEISPLAPKGGTMQNTNVFKAPFGGLGATFYLKLK